MEASHQTRPDVSPSPERAVLRSAEPAEDAAVIPLRPEVSPPPAKVREDLHLDTTLYEDVETDVDEEARALERQMFAARYEERDLGLHAAALDAMNRRFERSELSFFRTPEENRVFFIQRQTNGKLDVLGFRDPVPVAEEEYPKYGLDAEELAKQGLGVKRYERYVWTEELDGHHRVDRLMQQDLVVVFRLEDLDQDPQESFEMKPEQVEKEKLLYLTDIVEKANYQGNRLQ